MVGAEPQVSMPKLSHNNNDRMNLSFNVQPLTNRWAISTVKIQSLTIVLFSRPNKQKKKKTKNPAHSEKK